MSKGKCKVYTKLMLVRLCSGVATLGNSQADPQKITHKITV